MIGSVRIAWHSIFALIGGLIGGYVSFRCARYLVKDDRVYPFAFAVIIGGLIGGRVAHIVDNPGYYAGDIGKMLDISRGGIGTMGAPIGSSIAGLIFSRWLRLPRGFMFDISVIGISLGEAIGRLGDIVNGEHHGTACDLPWCVRYTHPLTLGQSTPVHPIGAYDALLMLVIFVTLLWLWRRVRGRPPEGRVYFAYLALLGAGRLLQGVVRVEPVVAFGFTEAELLGALYVVVGLGGLLAARVADRSRRTPS